MKYFLIQERHIPRLPNLDYRIHIYQRSQLRYFKSWYKRYLFHWHGRHLKFYIPMEDYSQLMEKVKDIGYHPSRYKIFISRFLKYLDFDPKKIFERADEWLDLDLEKLSDRGLARMIAKETTEFFVKKWYWLHLPPFFYGFELYLKEIMNQYNIPSFQIGEYISTLTIPEKLTANTQQEVEFLKLVLFLKKKSTPQVAGDAQIQRHYRNFQYAVSAFGNEPFSLTNLEGWIAQRSKVNSRQLKQRVKKLLATVKSGQKKKKKIFKVLGEDAGVKIVSRLLSGMAFIRERNKEALGKVLFAFSLLYKEAAKRRRIPLAHIDFYLLNELGQALLRNKKVSAAEIRRRRQCVVIFSKHNRYKKLLSGKRAHSAVEHDLREKANRDQSQLRGTCGNPGRAKGKVRIIQGPKDVSKMRQGEILLSPYTDHELVPAMKLASAIITDEGGILAHAAVISREFNIPCVIATGFATQVFKDGDRVEVDANRGIVRKLK